MIKQPLSSRLPRPCDPQRLVVSVTIASLLLTASRLSIEIARFHRTQAPMLNPIFDRRTIRSLLVGTVFLVASFCVDLRPSRAAIVAYLTESRALPGERFETDLVFSGSLDMIGDVIELINLDVLNSKINALPISDFSRVRFDASARFAPWQDGQQFGTSPGFESQVTLDSFAAPTPTPFPISDTDPFTVGTLTFDYGGLGLQTGDSVTLDIRGRNDGTATRTTSIAIRPLGTSMTMLVNPEFSSPAGTERSTFTIVTAIPEPSLATALSLVCIGAVMRRRPRRSGVGLVGQASRQV